MAEIETKVEPKELYINPKDLKLGDYIPDPKRLQEMVLSIREEGRLLHSPAVKDDKTIIAGRLRVYAAVQCKLSSIRCEEYPSDLEEDFYESLHLHEDLTRHNLPWAEIILYEKRFHELRMRQAGGPDRGRKGKRAEWGLRQTAEELKMSLGLLSEDLRLADAIMNDPSLAKIGDKTTAKKVIAESLKRLNQELGANMPVQMDTDVCHLGHSDAVLQIYPNNFFDACITDPPWLEFKDKGLIRDEFTLPVFKEIYRTLKRNAFLYAFVSTQDWYFYQEELQKIGFKVQKFPLIWVKEGVLTYGRKTWEYQRDYEPIIVAVKGDPAVSGSMLSSVISCKVVPSTLLRHPNEKPEQVINTLLEHCSYDGSIILDPFGGSGVVAACCKLLGRRYVTIERDPKHYQKITERLRERK